MRAKTFLKNGIIILAIQMFTYLMDFISRTVFIYALSMEYVGVKGLFNNILSILSLTELGVGTVLVYSMYKPMAEKNEQKLLALLLFYKKAYLLIACLIGGLGLILTPFLPYLIKDRSSIDGLYIIYLLYLFNSVSSYLFAYKFSIFLADQKLYVVNFWDCMVSTLRYAVQISILLLTGNFFLYLIVQPVFTLIKNLFLSKKAEKNYPFLKTNASPDLSKAEKKEILKNTFAMFNHRVGGTILNSTDNLIISSLIGITAVAINDTYALIVAMINQILGQIFSALTASIGNLNATESPETSYRVFKILHFSNFWFSTFCSACLFVLINPFIQLVWGEKYLFPLPVVVIICINFYIVSIRKIPLAFKESMGLLWPDRFKPLLESLINLIVSILAIHYLGIAGVFVGTFISMVSTSLWVEPYVLFRYGLKRSWKEFWLLNAKYYPLSFLLVALTYFIAALYEGPLFAMLVYRLFLCLFLPNIILLLLFCRSEEWKGLLASINLRSLFKKEKAE